MYNMVRLVCYDNSMVKPRTNSEIFLQWIIPSTSEAEYTYFVFLTFFGVLSPLIFHLKTIFNAFLTIPSAAVQIGLAILILCVVGLMLAALSATLPELRSLHRPDRSTASEYVLLPSLIIIVVSFIGYFMSGETRALGSFEEKLADLIVLRQVALILIIRLRTGNPRFEKIVESHYRDYQVKSIRGIFILASLAVMGAVGAHYAYNWFLGMVLAYGIGMSLISAWILQFPQPEAARTVSKS